VQSLSTTKVSCDSAERRHSKSFDAPLYVSGLLNADHLVLLPQPEPRPDISPFATAVLILQG
jgi:hypothetical protein